MYTNGLAMEELETLEDMMEDLEYDEMYESDESDESDLSERRRRMAARRRAPAPRTATGNQLYRSRPTSQYVTQTQLQSALARVGGQIKTNADAIKTVNSRTTIISTEQTRQAALLKKEVSDRKKQDDLIKQDVRQKMELLALLPALSRPSAETITTSDGKQVRVLTESNDSLSLLLPLLLVGGLGGLGGSGTGGSGTDSNMLLLVLALSGGLGGKK